MSATVSGSRRRNGGYAPPEEVQTITLSGLLQRIGRTPKDARQLDLLKIDPLAAEPADGVLLYAAGDISILDRHAIAVIGARDASREGCRRAARLGRELARHGVTVVSGLAAGIDTHALEGAIEAGGQVAAVIGTPIDKAYPAANKRLQEKIYRDHLLISQFESGSRVFPSNFPARNRIMAALSDASVIIEAGNTSGSLHQAAECERLGRWLGIAKSMIKDSRVDWPRKFTLYERTHILETVDGLLSAVYGVEQ